MRLVRTGSQGRQVNSSHVVQVWTESAGFPEEKKCTVWFKDILGETHYLEPDFPMGVNLQWAMEQETTGNR